jgi:hypothetical protein
MGVWNWRMNTIGVLCVWSTHGTLVHTVMNLMTVPAGRWHGEHEIVPLLDVERSNSCHTLAAIRRQSQAPNLMIARSRISS